MRQLIINPSPFSSTFRSFKLNTKNCFDLALKMSKIKLKFSQLLKKKKNLMMRKSNSIKKANQLIITETKDQKGLR